MLSADSAFFNQTYKVMILLAPIQFQPSLSEDETQINAGLSGLAMIAFQKEDSLRPSKVTEFTIKIKVPTNNEMISDSNDQTHHKEQSHSSSYNLV